MRAALLIVVSTAATSALLAAAACTTDYQKGLNDPTYGAPNALAGQQAPGPYVANAEGGAGGSGGGGGGGGGLLCARDGGTPADGGTCAVSFKTDVLGALTRANCATAGCHGGANPAQQPRIDPADPNSMYQEFQAFTVSTGAGGKGAAPLYINPCSTDPAQSGIVCNLSGTNTCGAKMPVGADIAAADLQKITDWVKCGAPNN